MRSSQLFELSAARQCHSVFDMKLRTLHSARARVHVVRLSLWLLSAVTLAGCLGISAKVSGASGAQEWQEEDAYLAEYAQHMKEFSLVLAGFESTDSRPGPCDVGGSVNACLAADAEAISGLSAMLEVVEGATPPPRLLEVDRLLRAAIRKSMAGFAMRDDAIRRDDESLWDQQKILIEEARSLLVRADAAFPSDHRPTLSP